MTETNGLVRYEAGVGVATVTLDSPHNRNALSAQLVAELTDRLGEAGADRDVRAVVLTHTGRVFCSGADLAAAASGSLGTDAIMALLRLIVELPKPVIARIAGHVRAGGMGIVGACDLAVAAEDASFAFTEARIGLAPAMISLTTLDIMDPRQAARYYLTGDTFGAPVAAWLGLITVACAGEELDGVVDGLVAQIRGTSAAGGGGDQEAADSGATAAAGHGRAGDGGAVGPAVRQRGGAEVHPRVPGEAAARSAGTVTIRERRYSPRPLACGSGRVVADTPGASRPWTTKLRARRFGSS